MGASRRRRTASTGDQTVTWYGGRVREQGEELKKASERSFDQS
jgi:hypothetical protein